MPPHHFIHHSLQHSYRHSSFYLGSEHDVFYRWNSNQLMEEPESFLREGETDRELPGSLGDLRLLKGHFPKLFQFFGKNRHLGARNVGENFSNIHEDLLIYVEVFKKMRGCF
jgi:hypothetical protein